MRTRSGRGASRGRELSGTEQPSAQRYGTRRPVNGRWLVLGKDGRLTAYARTDDGLLRWTETRPGGPAWEGPDFFPVPHLTHLSVVQGADTYVHFLGRRADAGRGVQPATDIVHAIQYQTGRPVTEWRSLGNPHADPEKAARLGAPAVAVSASGRVHVFVRNAGGGVMLRREASGGKWERWHDLRGSGVHDGLAALAHTSGRIELLAGAERNAMWWRQHEPDGELRREPNMPVRMAPGTASVIETGPGRATYYWTDPEAGGIVAHRLGGWLVPLGGAPAAEPVTVIRAVLGGYDCTVLAHRDAGGQVMLAACGTENEQSGVWWSQTGEHSETAPALAVDALGRVVLAVLGRDGSLRVARQSGEPGLTMTPSVPV
ncbi:hypothetical protein [Streptomyces sp. E5N91]|uniref:hypothetical protein n=1 Tax=Streptomyces sp. E5N91 TaxID=1851996 RepID=UPI000EF6333E|nr:hypothetical protein [Streptomyces sp. E5N91]